MENNNFVKSIRKSWFHEPVNQPSLVGNRCPQMQNDESSGKWCHLDNQRPDDLKYTVPVNDNEPFSNVSSGMFGPRNEYVPNSGLGAPSENIYYDFANRENLSLCNLDNGIPDGNDNEGRHFNWNNPEKLLYTEDLAPACNTTVPPVPTAMPPRVEYFSPETDSPNQQLTTETTTTPTPEQPVQIQKEVLIVPVESKKCRSAVLDMKLVKDILILIGLIGFLVLIIFIIRRYGKITEDLTSSMSLSFENV
jgi:hypothetical protein